VVNPYSQGLLRVPPIHTKRPVKAKVVCVLQSIAFRRGMRLMNTKTRTVAVGEVHELVLTDEPCEKETVERIGYVAFLAVVDSGVLAVGDTLSMGGRQIGHVVGFDDTHAPNHWNIIVRAQHLDDGKGLHLELDDTAEFIWQGLPENGDRGT